jgi:hypothetical protein
MPISERNIVRREEGLARRENELSEREAQLRDGIDAKLQTRNNWSPLLK